MPWFVVYFLGNLAWVAATEVVKSGLGLGLPEGANSHLILAEEAMKRGDWYTFSSEYHWLEGFMEHTETSGEAIRAALVRQRQRASQMIPTSYTLDTYTLGLSWLGQFARCKGDYTETFKKASQEFTKGNVTIDFLLNIMSPESRECTDVRPDDVKLLRIIRELADVLLRSEDRSAISRVGASFVQILEEAVKRYPSFNKSILYPDVLSDLALLKNETLEAIKILWEALKTHKDDSYLMNKLASNIADPSTFTYREVVETELPKLDLDSLCTCGWLNEFLKPNSWGEAFAAVESIIQHCRCGEQGIDEGLELLLKAFFKTGAFEFTKADHLLARISRQSKAFELRRNVKSFKEGLVKLINGKVDYLLRNDPDNCSIERLQRKVKESLDISYVNKAKEARKTHKVRERAAEQRRQEDIERRKKREAWEKEVERVKKASAQQDDKLDPKFRAYDLKSAIKSKEKAENALIELDRHLALGDYYGACPSYQKYDWNGVFVETRWKQSDIKDALDKLKPPLDRGVLCYCESNDYAKERYARLSRTREIVKGLRRIGLQQDVNESGLLKRLSDSRLKDPRDNCSKFKEVAQLLAEALLWNRSILVMNSHCKTPTCDDYGDLLGAFSLGLQEAFPVDRISEVYSVLEFIESHLSLTFDPESQWGKSLRWMAGLLSVRRILKQYIDGSRIPVGTLEEAMAALLPLGKQLALKSRVDFTDFLEKTRAKSWVQMLPLVEEFSRLTSQKLFQQKKAWEDRAYILFKYYAKAGDHYWRLVMLEEAFRCRSRPNDHPYLVVERVNVENEVLLEIRALKDASPRFLELKASVERYVKSLGFEASRSMSVAKRSTAKTMNPPKPQASGKITASESGRTKAKATSKKAGPTEEPSIAKHATKTTTIESQTRRRSSIRRHPKTRETKVAAPQSTGPKKTRKSQEAFSAEPPKKTKGLGLTEKGRPTIKRVVSIVSPSKLHEKTRDTSRTSPHGGGIKRRKESVRLLETEVRAKTTKSSPNITQDEIFCVLLELYEELVNEYWQGKKEEYQPDLGIEDPYVVLLRRGY